MSATNWQDLPLKRVAAVMPSNVDKHTIEGEQEVLLCNYVDVYKNERISLELDFMQATASAAQVERFTLRESDVIVTKDSEEPTDIGIPAYVPKDLPGVVCGYHLAILRPHDERLFGGYLHWALQSQEVRAYFSTAATGISRYALGISDLGMAPLRVPNRDAQVHIANFLDDKTARIDALIAEKERLVGSLGDYRLSVVSHAISGGLTQGNRGTETRDMWFGALPQHWAFCPLNYRYEVQLGKMLDEKRITGENLRPYLRNTDVQWGRINADDLPTMDIYPDELLRYAVRPGDLLVCEGGDVGRAAIWEGAPDEIGYQKALHRVRPRSPSDVPKFLFYALFDSAKRGRFADREKATIAHLTAEAFRRYRFPFPPEDEQRAIVAYLDAQMSRLDDLRTHSLSHIARLREYRSSLISAAVTGQLAF